MQRKHKLALQNGIGFQIGKENEQRPPSLIEGKFAGDSVKENKPSLQRFRNSITLPGENFPFIQQRRAAEPFTVSMALLGVRWGFPPSRVWGPP